jgi:hypothetical protein
MDICNKISMQEFEKGLCCVLESGGLNIGLTENEIENAASLLKDAGINFFALDGGEYYGTPKQHR